MNEQLQQALTTILNKTVDGIDTGVAFMQSELPDVIEQLLMWYAVKGLILTVLGLLLLIVPFKSYRKLKQHYEDSNGYDFGFEVVFPTCIISVIIGITSLILINLNWLQIWIAPKIWLIEYAASLAK